MALYNVPEGLSQLTVNDFKSVSDKYEGLAKSARYTVFFKLGRSAMSRLGYQNLASDLSYLCESTEIPGRGFMHVDLRYYGPNFKLPFQTTYEDITFTFLCRNKSVERQMFDDWLEIINPTNTFDFAYRDDYACEIDVFTYGEVGATQGAKAPKAEYCITLRNAWPVLVNPQPVTWADDNFQRLGVTFTYEKWVRVNKNVQPGTYQLVAGRNSDI